MKNTYIETINNRGKVSKLVISLVALVTLLYFTWWLDLNNAGHPILYAMLVVGEIFHVWQALGYAFTIWDQRRPEYVPVKNFYPVDVFITVCGEPAEIVEKTLESATTLEYPNYHVYVLNDGKGAKKDNWEEINQVAEKYGATPITRDINKGAKAGNINNGLRQTSSPFIVVFDADHIPEKNFLLRTMGYFQDERMALVQTPQYYSNKDDNYLTKASWEQQELFFGPICNGKNASNATFWCGTNAVVRRKALDEIGGVPEDNIAEDFLASLFIHQKGWRTMYIPEVLAKGLAPHNLGDYINQQFRWARGSLEVIFKYNPLFKKGLTWKQKFQYLYSSGYYLNGLIVLIDASIPLLALGLNALPVNAETSDFMVYFFPFMFLTIYLLMKSTKNQITFDAIQMSMSSFFVFLAATFSTLFRVKTKFKVTSKAKASGNYLKFIIPHVLYTVISAVVIGKAVMTHGLVPSVVTNASWAIFNIVFFFGFVKVAYPWETLFEKSESGSLSVINKNTVTSVSPEKKWALSYVENSTEEKYEKK